jgi:mannose-6-phosphate isomerase-like protein (cupin superfamily)
VGTDGQELRSGRGTIFEIFSPDERHAVDMHIIALLPFRDQGLVHYHSRSANYLYVLSGAVTVRLESGEVRLETNDAVRIAPGIVHSVSNLESVEARVLEIYTPAPSDFIEAQLG